MPDGVDENESDASGYSPDAPPPIPAHVSPVPPPPKPFESPLKNYHVEIRAAHALAIAILVLTLDYLLYQGAGGLSFSAAFAALSIVIAMFAFNKIRFIPLAFYGVLCSLVIFRCAWQYGALVVIAGAVLLVAFAVTLRLGQNNIPNLMASLPLTAIMGVANWPCDLIAKRRASPSIAAGLKRGVPVAVVAIPLLVCVAFAWVFILSNPIIRDSYTHWYSALEKGLTTFWKNFGPNPTRIIFWLACIYYVSLVLRPAIYKSRDSSPWQINAVTPGQVYDAHDIHYRVALNTLIAVNILFLLYNGVDAYYLLVRDALPAGLNHSQYAHHGAFWLTVALAMTTFVVGCIFHSHLNFHSKRKTLLNWTGLWLLQNFVLASWVFLRINMYVGYNGMTRMRMVALVGTALVVIGLVLVAVKAARKQSLTWLVRKELGAFFLACMLLAVLPMDYLSWRYNAPNILASDPPRTTVQLVAQPMTPEGLATLTPLLDHPDPIIATGVAAMMGQWYFDEGQAYVDANIALDRWTRYQMGHAWCARVLANHEDKILALVPDQDWDAKIQALRKHTARWI
jgi:hypothetical protein